MIKEVLEVAHTLRKDNEELRNACETLKAEYKELENHCQIIETEKNNIQTAREVLEQEFEAASERYHQDKENYLNQAGQTNSDMDQRHELDSSEREHDLQKMYEKKIEAGLANWEKYRESSNKWKTEADDLKAKMQLVMERHKSEINSMKAELQKSQGEIESLQENNEIFDLQSKVMKLQRSEKLGWIQVESREKEVKEFRERCEAMNKELHTSKGKQDSRLCELKEKNHRIQAEILQWKEKCHDQEKEILLLRDLLNVTETKLQKVTKSKHKFGTICDEKASKIRTLEKKLKLSEGNNVKRLQDLELEYKAKVEEIKSEIGSKLSIQECAREETEQNLKSITLKHREDLARLRQQLQQMNEKCQHFESLHQNAQVQMEKSRTSFEDEVKILNQDLRSCRDKVKNLRSENSQYQDVIKAKDETVKKNLAQIEKMNLQIEQLTNEVHSIDGTYRESLKQTQELKIHNTSLKTTLEFREKELAKLQES